MKNWIIAGKMEINNNYIYFLESDGTRALQFSQNDEIIEEDSNNFMNLLDENDREILDKWNEIFGANY